MSKTVSPTPDPAGPSGFTSRSQSIDTTPTTSVKRMSVHPPAAPKLTQGREMRSAEFCIAFENHSIPMLQPRTLSQTANPLASTSQYNSMSTTATTKAGMTIPKSFDQSQSLGASLKSTHGGRIVRYFPEWALMCNQKEDPVLISTLEGVAVNPEDTMPPSPMSGGGLAGGGEEDGIIGTLNGVPMDQLLAPARIVGSRAADWVRVPHPDQGPMQKALKTTYKGVKAAEVHESLMSAFWDSIHGVTGFTKLELEYLRQTPVERDVCEEPMSAEYEFADNAAILQLRLDLQDYLDALRTLQGFNDDRSAKKMKLKNFVEDTKYKTAREAEVTLRMTPGVIAKRFIALTYAAKKIKSITCDIVDLGNVEELVLTNNLIESLEFLPAKVQIASFDGNCISQVDPGALLHSPELIFLGLSCNSLTSQALSFLRATQSLVIVDLSYNEISEIMPVVDVLADHPSLREVDLSGNPIALLPKYRQVIASMTQLTVLDGVPVMDAERTELKNQLQVEEALKEAVAVHFSLDSVRGVLSLMPRFVAPEEDKQVVVGGKLGAKDSKAKAAAEKAKKGKGGGVVEEPHANAGSVTIKKTHIMLKGSWLQQPFSVEADLLQTPQPTPEDDATAGTAGKKGGGLGGAGGKDVKNKNKAAHQELTPQVLDNLPLKHSAKVELNPTSDLTTLSADLFYPLKVQCYLIDTMQNDTTNEVQLGTFHVDLARVNGPTTHDAATANLAVHSVLIANTQKQILSQKKEVERMIAHDRELDKQHLDTPTPTDGPAAVAATGKGSKGVQGGKGGAQSKVANEELLQRQAESQQRKVEIEEAHMKQSRMELDLQRFQNIHVSLKVQFSVNPPPVVQEVPVVVPRAEEEPTTNKGKDKKKKK